jgi:hypothetical protein
LAVIAALMNEEDREEERARRDEIRRCPHEQAVARQAQRETRQALGKRLDSIDRIMAGYHRRVGKTVEVHLTALGYHRHARGQWRRRRQPMSIELVKAKAPDLAALKSQDLDRLIRESDRAMLERLGCQADHMLYELAGLGGGHLPHRVKWLLAQSIGPGEGAIDREAILAQVATLKRELAPIGSSLPERLLAERAAVGWLHVQLLEIDRADRLQQGPVDYRGAEALDRWLSRAQSRYTQALTALAKVRRLKLPVVVATQINVDHRSARG